MSRRHLLKPIVISLAAVGSITAIAAEYFLWQVNMSYAADADGAFEATQNYFRMAQPTLNASGKWRPGDVFVVRYNDGTIAKFTLSTRGMACISNRCSWTSSVPLNDPPTTVIQPRVSGTQGTVQVTYNGDTREMQQNPTNYADLVWQYALQSWYEARRWTITIGPIVPAPIPGGGSGGCHDPRNPCTRDY